MSESRGDFTLALAVFEKQKKASAQIDDWIHSHPGEISVESLSAQFDIDEDYCRRMVESNADIATIVDDSDKVSQQKVYVSLALPQNKSFIGDPVSRQKYLKKEKLGIDARADFYELIRLRSLNLHQGKKRHVFTNGRSKLKS